MSERIIGLIPARMGSSRFPGKPIVDICGKPMLYWVYKQVSKVSAIDKIYVVTRDYIIFEKCAEYRIPCLIERRPAKSATEMLSYTVRKLDGSIYLNIQGDEPLINPKAIEEIIGNMILDKDVYYLGLRSKIKTEEEYRNPNIVKVVVDSNNFAMYFSRTPIPYTYNPCNSFRVIGVYGYRANFLKKFSGFPESELEKLEGGVEMLRIIESGYKIKLLETEYTSIGVDLPEHIQIVEAKMIKKE